MTVEQVLNLVNAGFTREQIMHLESTGMLAPAAAPAAAPAPAAPAAAPAAAPTPAAAPAAAPTPAAAPAAAPAPAAPAAGFDSILAEVEKIKQALQTTAILGMQQPAQSGKTSVDILAAVIAPPKNLTKEE